MLVEGSTVVAVVDVPEVVGAPLVEVVEPDGVHATNSPTTKRRYLAFTKGEATGRTWLSTMLRRAKMSGGSEATLEAFGLLHH